VLTATAAASIKAVRRYLLPRLLILALPWLTPLCLTCGSNRQYVMALDGDDSVDPYYLEEAVKILDNQPGIALVYPDQTHIWPDKVQVFQSSDWDLVKFREVNLLPHYAIFRRFLWEEIGGFQTNVIGYEDWDLWVSMGEKGWFGKLLEEPRFLYRKHGSSILKETYAKYEDWSRARLIVNHPKLYPSASVDKAKQVLQQAEELELLKPVKESGGGLSILIFHYEKPIDPAGINAGAEMALIHLARAG